MELEHSSADGWANNILYRHVYIGLLLSLPPGIVVHANNSSTQKAEVRDCDLVTSLGYRTRACLKERGNSDSWCDISQFLENKYCIILPQSVQHSESQKAETRHGCCVPVISALGRWKQDDPGIQSSLTV